MGARLGLKLPEPVEMEGTNVLRGHLCRMEVPLRGAHFSKERVRVQ